MTFVNYAGLSTEQINPRSEYLDQLSPLQIIRLMNREDKWVLRSIASRQKPIAKAVSLIVRSLADRGKILMVGAGTSGRLGVLEAAECPPTFNTSPSLIQAAMAGGRSAVFRSKEGAEDSERDGRSAVRRTKIRKSDVVIGIAASGVTPFVKAALLEALRAKAKTILLTCNPKPPTGLADVVIALATGPEILAGSTRLKAGTACKMVLNMLTTASMVQLGKVYGNRMVDLQPKSRKLTERGIRLIGQLGRVGDSEARRIFKAAHGRIKLGIVMARLKCSARQAQKRLAQAHGFLRAVL